MKFHVNRCNYTTYSVFLRLKHSRNARDLRWLICCYIVTVNRLNENKRELFVNWIVTWKGHAFQVKHTVSIYEDHIYDIILGIKAKIMPSLQSKWTRINKWRRKKCAQRNKFKEITIFQIEQSSTQNLWHPALNIADVCTPKCIWNIFKAGLAFFFAFQSLPFAHHVFIYILYI